MFARDYDEFGPFGHGRGRGGSPPPPPPPLHFGGFDGGFRAGRGMMEPAVLSALAEKPMHGYEVISYLEEKSHGMWRPSPGSIYPTLQLLEEKDLVACAEQDGKKTYRLTSDGEAEAAGNRDHMQAVFSRFADTARDEGRRMNFNHDYQRQFHKQAGEIVKLVRQIFRKGSSHQKAALDNAINEFKARLEQIWEGEV